MQNHSIRLPVWILILILTPLSACGGGGSTPPAPLGFQLLSIQPPAGPLGGGSVVRLQGNNFQSVSVTAVNFGTVPGTAVTVINDNTIEVTVPPAPVAGSVDVTVETMDAGSEMLPGAFAYNDAPVPQALIGGPPTATGSEPFTITGSGFGPPGTTLVTVEFQGLPPISAVASTDGTTITGNFPVQAGPPAPVPLSVTVHNADAQLAVVPGTVTYQYAAPLPFGVPFQTGLGASEPVMITSSVALVSTAGPDGTWGNVDDEVFLVTGLPVSPVATPLRRPGGFAVGHLDPANSRPTRLDGDTAAVYSVGGDTFPTTGDDRITILDTLTGTPTIADYPAPYLIPAPPARIAGDRLAALGATAPPAGDGLPGTLDDEMVVMDLTAGTTLTMPSGPLDPAGAASLSLPVAADRSTAFFINMGADTTPGTVDDVLVRLSVGATLGGSGLLAAYALHRPLVISSTEVALATAGADGLTGTGDDALNHYQWAGSPGFTAKPVPGIDGLAVRVAVRLGSRGVAVATLGPDFPALSGDEELQLFLDISDTISVSRSAPGRSVLAPLGSGSVLVYGPGLDLTPGGGDDQAWHLDASGGFNALGPAPFWPQTRLPATDQDRGFAMSPGPDGAWGTGDETVVVHSGAVLGSAISASLLPATTGSPVTVFSRLIPVGPSWGLVQSPGVDGAFMTGDEQLVVVRY